MIQSHHQVMMRIYKSIKNFMAMFMAQIMVMVSWMCTISKFMNTLHMYSILYVNHTLIR